MYTFNGGINEKLHQRAHTMKDNIFLCLIKHFKNCYFYQFLGSEDSTVNSGSLGRPSALRFIPSDQICPN